MIFRTYKYYTWGLLFLGKSRQYFELSTIRFNFTKTRRNDYNKLVKVLPCEISYNEVSIYLKVLG